MKKGLLRASLILSLIVGAICGGVFGMYSYAVLPFLPLMMAISGGVFSTLYLLIVAAGCGVAIFILSIILLAKLGNNTTMFHSKGLSIANLILELVFIASLLPILLVARAAIDSSSLVFYVSMAAMGLVAILTLFGIMRASRVAKISPEVLETTETKEEEK